ncbi:MAG: gliding motility-associated C-terminal domain-containing protein [Flavobacteriales bacterium]|nr:gliding motility-associated C-terminal domain-containing protein [Flavobacteriales bacterium]
MKNAKIIYTIFALLVLCLQLEAQPDWDVNPADYQFTMTFTGTGTFNCEETSNTSDRVAAFVGDECRGVANFETEANGSFLAYLTVYGNQFEGTELSFKLYRAETGDIIDSPKKEIFSDGAIWGNPEEPYAFLTEYAISDVYLPGDSLLSSYEPGTAVSELFLIDASGDTLTGNFEFINDAKGPDNDQFSLLTSFLILENNLVPEVQDTLQIHLNGFTEGGCGIDEVIFLPVTNTNSPPKGLLKDTLQIKENLEAGSLVGILEADDDSPDDSHTFSFFDGANPNPDHAAFDILSPDIQTARVLNYESQVWYSLFIRIVDEAGNALVDTLVVEVLDEVEFDDLKAGNLITPDSDGFNDTFTIPNIELFQNYELFIYNAQGVEVYSSGEYDNSWVGTSNNGNELPSATYYYVFRDRNVSENMFKGEIHIYRNNKF